MEKAAEPSSESVEETLDFETGNPIVERQYDLLGILDSKVSALLMFDGVALASLSIWLSYVPLNWLHFTLDLVFLALLASCALLLPVVWLRWARPGEALEFLNRIRLVRTKLYTCAWWLAMASVTVLVLASVVHTLGTLLIAADWCGQTCQTFYSDDVFGNLDYSQD